jgi:hypothetical protein
MKRRGNLYPKIVEFENILLSTKKAEKGKRFRENVLEFNYNLEAELIKLQQELKKKIYQPGDYRIFYSNPKSLVRKSCIIRRLKPLLHKLSPPPWT